MVPVTAELDIYRTANELIKKHGLKGASVFAATIIASVTIVASLAFAYHPDHDPSRGGGSIGPILPIVIVVVIGMVGLGIWERKKPKTKSKRKHKRR
jgi:hypothetical protein